MNPVRIVTAITGASGALYGVRFVVRAAELGADVDLLVSTTGVRVVKEELGFDADPTRGEFRERLGAHAARVRRIPVADLGADIASGSVPVSGMAIIPCSMGCAGRIAAGTSGSLVERAADVTLKERRPLVIVPRETPFNRIHLANLLALADAGATIVPAMPAFYARPTTIDDLVDTVVDRALATFFGPDAVRSRWDPRSPAR